MPAVLQIHPARLLEAHRAHRPEDRRTSVAERERIVRASPSSERISVPETFGCLAPVVLLPAEAADWNPERIDVVLAHEFVHIQRRDWLTQLLAQFSACVYWFHPFAWIALKQMRKERELACDDGVLRLGYKSSDYARHLVDVARCVRNGVEALSPSVAMACRAQLESRIRALSAFRFPGPLLRRRMLLPAAFRNQDLAHHDIAALARRVAASRANSAEPLVIIGPRTAEQLDENLHALDITLSKETLSKLDEIFPGPGGAAPEAYAW